MIEEKLAPHIEELTRVLKEKVEPEKIKDDLEKLVGEFKIPISEAKRMTIRKYGGSLPVTRAGVQYTLKELLPNEPNVELLCRVVAINEKQIISNEEEKTIYYGILGDHTMTRPFTAWQECGLEKGDTVRIQNAYTKEWQGDPQIHLGNRAIIVKESKDALPPFDPTTGAVEHKIGELKERMGSIALTARILSIEEREVNVSGEQKKLFNGMLADETGQARFTAWDDFKLKEGEVIKIIGGYVKSWRGIPDITFDTRSIITKLENDVLPDVKELEKDRTIEIGKLVELGGGTGIEINGVVLQVKNGSGLIFRCPECKRVVQNGSCMIHGEVRSVPDLRVKVVIDDGTGALNSIFNKEITEKLLGKNLEKCQEIAKEAMERSVIKEELSDILTANPVKVSGNALGDDYGVMLIARNVELLNVDTKKEAEKLLMELEV